MRPTGKRIAIGTAALGIAVLGAAAFTARDRLAEEWYLYRLRSGGEDAKARAFAWIGEHGTERCLLELMYAHLEVVPELILLKDMGREEGTYGDHLEPIAFSRCQTALVHPNRKAAMSSEVRLYERIGKERIGGIVRKVLAGMPCRKRVSVFLARAYFRRGADLVGPGPDIYYAARCRLVEALSDPDALVRAGACYGLADLGESAREAIPAVEALRNDPDDVVREAAEYAAKVIRGGQP